MSIKWTANQGNQNNPSDELSVKDSANLVGAFLWLIEEDKKQNPNSYNLNPTI